MAESWPEVYARARVGAPLFWFDIIFGVDEGTPSLEELVARNRASPG